MSSFNMYPAVSGDRQELIRLDIKCYDYPLSFDDWGEVLTSDKNKIGDYVGYRAETFKRNNTILGYVVYAEQATDDGDMECLRLGVLPSVRRQGVGKMLVDHLRSKAHTKGMNEVQFMISEYYLDPDEARGVDDFISTTGLVLHDQIKGAYFHYGREYDGIIFRTGGTPVPLPT